MYHKQFGLLHLNFNLNSRQGQVTITILTSMELTERLPLWISNFVCFLSTLYNEYIFYVLFLLITFVLVGVYLSPFPFPLPHDWLLSRIPTMLFISFAWPAFFPPKLFSCFIFRFLVPVGGNFNKFYDPKNIWLTKCIQQKKNFEERGLEMISLSVAVQKNLLLLVWHSFRIQFLQFDAILLHFLDFVKNYWIFSNFLHFVEINYNFFCKIFSIHV